MGVVEVKPESDYRLFVRFKDGLAGRVQLRREELKDALAPLLEVTFFEQVFIDAPDAMQEDANRVLPGYRAKNGS